MNLKSRFMSYEDGAYSRVLCRDCVSELEPFFWIMILVYSRQQFGLLCLPAFVQPTKRARRYSSNFFGDHSRSVATTSRGGS
jgi:hypothetical protein